MPSQTEKLGRRALVREVMVTLSELQRYCGDGRNFQKDNHHCNTPPIWDLWQKPLLNKRHRKTLLEFANSQTVTNKLFWSDAWRYYIDLREWGSSTPIHFNGWCYASHFSQGNTLHFKGWCYASHFSQGNTIDIFKNVLPLRLTSEPFLWKSD